MKAQILKFPNFFRPATRRDEPCVIVILPVVRIIGIDLGVERECPKITELRRQSRRLREHFKREFSGGPCGGGEG